jgi:hypothetical protein
MRKQMSLTAVAAAGVLSVLLSLPGRPAHAQTVFQAAGPDAASIQGTVGAFRAALGEPNNGNTAGPLPSGRREINWDGGNADPATAVTTAPANPFVVFQNTRGATFTTPGTGLSQGPPAGGADGGFANLFGNPTYADDFTFFSTARLFSPVGSNFTDGVFSVPGTGGAQAAIVTGFGAVFTDVDKPGGVVKTHSTQIEYFDIDGRKIFTGLVPAAPGDKGLSFFGVVFDGPIIARVRIKTGDTKPGLNDDPKDIVMMDDFLYGEPQPAVQ